MSSPRIRGDNTNLDHIGHETEADEARGGAAGDVPAEERAFAASPVPYMDDLGSECAKCRREVEQVVSRAVGNPALVENAVAVAISRLIASGGFDSNGEKVRSVKGYLIRVAHRLAIDALRRKSPSDNPRNVSLSDAAREERFLAVTADAFSERVEADDALKAAVGALTPGERELIRMKFFEEMSTKEIAAVVKVSEPTVRARIYKACAKMRLAVYGRA